MAVYFSDDSIFTVILFKAQGADRFGIPEDRQNADVPEGTLRPLGQYINITASSVSSSISETLMIFGIAYIEILSAFSLFTIVSSSCTNKP